MGVYVKDMEMPKNCMSCDIEMSCGYCPRLCRDTIDIRHNKRFDDCPLVEVKAPHGKLIDVDDFLERLKEKDRSFSFFFDGMFVEVSSMVECLGSIKTVIEAERPD